MELTQPATRRRHSKDLKARVLAECAAPGASVAAIALAHGLDTNLVHRWRRLVVPSEPRTPVKIVSVATPIPESAPMIETTAFVPLTVAPSTSEPAIEIELRRGPLTMKVSWPHSAAAQCAAWAREILR